jgi:hypothetical protein
MSDNRHWSDLADHGRPPLGWVIPMVQTPHLICIVLNHNHTNSFGSSGQGLHPNWDSFLLGDHEDQIYQNWGKNRTSLALFLEHSRLCAVLDGYLISHTHWFRVFENFQKQRTGGSG